MWMWFPLSAVTAMFISCIYFWTAVEWGQNSKWQRFALTGTLWGWVTVVVLRRGRGGGGVSFSMWLIPQLCPVSAFQDSPCFWPLAKKKDEQWASLAREGSHCQSPSQKHQNYRTNSRPCPTEELLFATCPSLISIHYTFTHSREGKGVMMWASA